MYGICSRQAWSETLLVVKSSALPCLPPRSSSMFEEKCAPQCVLDQESAGIERYSSSSAGTFTVTGSFRNERFRYGQAATMVLVEGPGVALLVGIFKDISCMGFAPRVGQGPRGSPWREFLRCTPSS